MVSVRLGVLPVPVPTLSATMLAALYNRFIRTRSNGL